MWILYGGGKNNGQFLDIMDHFPSQIIIFGNSKQWNKFAYISGKYATLYARYIEHLRIQSSIKIFGNFKKARQILII